MGFGGQGYLSTIFSFIIRRSKISPTKYWLNTLISQSPSQFFFFFFFYYYLLLFLAVGKNLTKFVKIPMPESLKIFIMFFSKNKHKGTLGIFIGFNGKF
jgi:hypothetical protein